MTPAPRLVAALLAALTALSISVGCGVPIDSEPRAITRTTLDPDTDEQRQTPTTSNSPGASQVEAYFMGAERLEPAEFGVEGSPTIEQALAFAIGDPPAGLTSSIPSGTEVLSIRVEDEIATIDLTNEINDVSGPTQKQAYAQLVFTAFAVGDDLTAVRFQVEGQPVDAPTDNGNQPRVTQFDYQDLRPLP